MNNRTIPQRPLRILSLGWGVQSWALAAMMAKGEIEPVDYAIHADTTHEAAGTYAHAKKWTPWLEDRGVKVVTVRSDDTRVVQTNWKDATLIPAYTFNQQDGSGQIKRQCTQLWKIRPLRRKVRELLGYEKGTPPAGAVEMEVGISWDEAIRMSNKNDVRYITTQYPLADRRITRADCILWLDRHGLDVPPKSACTFCPFHRIGHWAEMKRAGGSDWARAVQVDETIRHKREAFELFVHPYRKPLAEAVDIPEDHGASQLGLDLVNEQPCDSGACFT